MNLEKAKFIELNKNRIEDFMLNLKKNMVYLILALMTFASINTLQASESNETMYVIETDSLGRTIILWIESLQERTLKISINHGTPIVISTPGQNAMKPKMDITPRGDIIVIWSSVGSQRTQDLNARVLQYDGKWSQVMVLNEKSEAVLPNSYKLVVNNENDISIFWESLTFIPSIVDENIIVDRRELRCVTGSRKGWSLPRTVALLRQDQE